MSYVDNVVIQSRHPHWNINVRTCGTMWSCSLELAYACGTMTLVIQVEHQRVVCMRDNDTGHPVQTPSLEHQRVGMRDNDTGHPVQTPSLEHQRVVCMRDNDTGHPVQTPSLEHQRVGMRDNDIGHPVQTPSLEHTCRMHAGQWWK